MNAGLDPGYDIGQLSTGPEVEIYTTLIADGNSVNFAQQALPMADFDKNIVSVGIDSEKGGEVTFSAFTVPLAGYKFWLEDRTAGIFTELNTKSYTVTLPEKTYGIGRFFMHVSAKMPSSPGDLPLESTGIRIWGSGDKVIIKGSVSSSASCTVFNLRGEKIIESRLADGELNTVTIPSGSKGLFFVKVADGSKVTTGKVALF